VRAASYLRKVPRPTSASAAKSAVREAIRAAAAALGNTPAVCRRSYVHPKVVASWLEGGDAPPVALRGLRADEQATLGVLVATRGAAKSSLRRMARANPTRGQIAAAAAVG
jgi:DNA topoisomerase-1